MDLKQFALVMSPVAGGNLATYYSLAAHSINKLSLLRGFFGCIANALQYLHDSRIRHRDIKLGNIFVKGDPCVSCPTLASPLTGNNYPGVRQQQI
jgi:serine/threonine protein kinase